MVPSVTGWYPALERPPQPPPTAAAGSIPVDGLVGPLRLADLPAPFGFPKDPAATVVLINVKAVNVQRNNTLTAVSVGINTLDVNALFVNRLAVTTLLINTAQLSVIRLNEVIFNAVVINQLFANRIVVGGVFGNYVALNSAVVNDIFANAVFVLQNLQLNSLALNLVLINCVLIDTLVLNSIFINVVFVNVVLINSVFLNAILANTVYSNLTIINRVLCDSVLLNVVRANELATNGLTVGVLTVNSVSTGGVVTNKADTITAELFTLLSHSGGAMGLDPFAQLSPSMNASAGANQTTETRSATAEWRNEWWTTVPFDTRLHGSLPVWNTTTNAYTASADGLYHVECALLVSANALTPALAALGTDRFAALQLHLVSPANGTGRASLAVGEFARDLASGAVDPIGNQHSAPAALTLSVDVALRVNQTLAFRVLIPTPPAATDSSTDDATAVRLLWAASLSLVPSRASFAFLHPLSPPAFPGLPPPPF